MKNHIWFVFFNLLFILINGNVSFSQSITFSNPSKRLINSDEKLIANNLPLITVKEPEKKAILSKKVPSQLKFGKPKAFQIITLKTNPKILRVKPVFVARKSFRILESANYAIKQYGIANGLPSSDISALFERKNGEIWFAFSGGVGRILSNKILIYSAANGFPDFNILDICEFNNKMYFATFGGGLVELDKQQIHLYNTSTGFPTDHILNLKTHKKSLFVGTYSSGLVRFSAKKIEQIVSADIKKNGNIISQIISNNNELYIVSASSFGKLSQTHYTPVSFGNSISLQKVFIHKENYWLIDKTGKIYVDNQKYFRSIEFDSPHQFSDINFNREKVLLAHETGFLTLSGDYYTPHCSKENFKGSVEKILVDRFENFWLTCPKNGLVLISKTKFKNVEWDGNYFTLCIGPNNSLVYENKQGGGLVFNYRTHKKRIVHPLLKNLRSIAYNKTTKEFWILTEESKLFKITSDKKLLECKLWIDYVGAVGDLNYLNFDYANRLVISSYNFGLIRQEANSFYFFHQWYDLTGNYDLSSQVISSNRLVENSSMGKIAFFTDKEITVYSLSEKSLNTKIYSVYEIKKDSFLVATSAGLYSFCQDEFKRLELPTGLNQQRIYSCYFHKQSKNLYLSTRIGLYEYNVKTKKTLLYDEEYGLISSDFSRVGIVELNGKIYWPSSAGIVQFDTRQNHNYQTKTQIGVEFLSIKNNSLEEYQISSRIDPSNKLELPHEFNTIELAIHCNYWGRELATNIYYKLDEQKQWLELDNNASLLLQNLNSGKHTLSIRVEYPDIPDAHKTIYFEISNAFYEQLWFILLCSIVSLVLIYLFFKRIQSSDFDKLENYNNTKFLINKTRLLAISCLILLLFADLYLYNSLKNYSINWYVNGCIILLTFGLYSYTHIRQINSKIVRFATASIYILVCFVLVFRCYNNDYLPVLSVEIGLVAFYSIFIYKNFNRLILFVLGFCITSFTFIYFSTASADNKIIYVVTIVLNFVAVLIHTIIESRNLSKVLFSDRLLQNAQQFVVVYDFKGNVVYLNQFLLEKVKHSESELLGQAWWDFLLPDENERKAHKISIQQLVESKNSSSFSTWIEDNECLILWKETAIDGKYILAIGDDITVEEQQKEELKKLSLVAKNVTNGVVILDKDNLIEWANDSFIQLMEYSLEEIIGKRPIELFSGNLINVTHEIITNANDGNFDIVQYTKSGKPKDLLVNENELLNEDGELFKYVMIVTDITERKKEQEKYKFVIENAADVLYTADNKGAFTFVSPNIKEIFGFTPEELIGKHFTSIVKDVYKKSSIEFYQKQILEKEAFTNLEFEVVLKDNSTNWVSQNVRLLYQGERFIGVQGIVKNIQKEKLKQLEEQILSDKKTEFDEFLFKQSLISIDKYADFDDYLHQLISEIKKIIEIDRVSLWDYNADYVQCHFANFDFNSEEKILRSEFPNYYTHLEKGNILISTDAQSDFKTVEFLDSYLKPKNILSVVDFPIRIDGQIVSVLTLEETNERKIRSSIELEFIHTICDLIEINSQSFKRRDAEKRIKESETNFRLLNETLQDVFWLKDLEKQSYIYVSPSTKNLFGVSAEAFILNKDIWKSYIHPADFSILEKAKQALENNDDYDIEYRILLNNTIKWIHERFFVIYDENGLAIKSSGVSSDITADKNTRDEIKRLSLVAEKAANGVTICDMEGRMMYANDSYLEMFEISWDELKGKKPRELFSNHDKPLHEKLDQLNSSVDNYILEIFAKTFKNNDIWIELNTTIVLNEDGEEIQVEIVNNITERKHAEQVIYHQNKEILASIRYAQRIQNALFTPLDYFKTLPFETLLFHQAKDIVGGDFYWAEETENAYIIAIGDCTGHGVPGALMTSLAINGLMNAVLDSKLEEPGQILKHLDKHIISILSVNEESESVDDGMDMVVLRIDKLTQEITFSGAGRPLYIIDQHESIKIDGSKRSIGSKMTDYSFQTVPVKLKAGELLVVFSDGIPDQFSSETNKKLGGKKLIAFLQNKLNSDTSIPLEELRDFIKKHQCNAEQTDDMVLFGLQLKTQV